MNFSSIRRFGFRTGCAALLLGTALTGLGCNKSDSTAVNGGSGSGGGGGQVQLVGAGATFPAPLYGQWFKDYKAAHPNVVVDYQGVGSGAGISQFTKGTVDFGASDAAMSDEEIAAVKGGVVLLPMTAGSVVLSYNLEGIPDLKLTRDAYVGIFMGKVTKWNDPAIAGANSGAALPDKPINVVHRADGSGTTYVFTHHLAAVDPAWKAAGGPGVGKTAQWPAGQVGGKGNDGVTNAIKGTPGSIGYVEFSYAMTSGLPMAQLQNKAGKFVKATPESGAAALATVTMPDDLRAWAPDPEGDGSYPIVTYTWLLCHPKYDDAAKGKALKEVINYCLTDGQKISKDLGYIPLPDAVVARVKEKADTIKGG